MPTPTVWIDDTLAYHPLLARRDRTSDGRPDSWRLGFGHGYTSTWTDGRADRWDEAHNGDIAYGDGFNAGADLAAFHRGDTQVVDLAEVL